jgi:hypothetical protein
VTRMRRSGRMPWRLPAGLWCAAGAYGSRRQESGMFTILSWTRGAQKQRDLGQAVCVHPSSSLEISRTMDHGEFMNLDLAWK